MAAKIRWSPKRRCTLIFAIALAAVTFTPILSGAEDSGPDSPSIDSKIPDYTVSLNSGLIIDIGKIFRPEIDEFRESLNGTSAMRGRSAIRLFHDQTKQPRMIAQRRGRVLDGSFASFADDGNPVAFASYRRGKKDGSFLAWDESHRPLIFSQYRDDKLDGIRCLFRGCCDTCKDGHVWLIEEYSKGKLRRAHLAQNKGNAKSFTFLDGKLYEGDDDDEQLELAQSAIAKFERQLKADESDLVKFVAQYYSREKQIESQRMQLAQAQRSYGFAMAFQASRYPSAPIPSSQTGMGAMM